MTADDLAPCDIKALETIVLIYVPWNNPELGF